ILYAPDNRLSMLPYAFHVRKDRRDLLESINRAVSIVYPAYPTIMSRYNNRYLPYRPSTPLPVRPLSIDLLSQIFILFAIL
ncbi:hypothetical protein PFISCL1PPCAC_23507, partial [Pristionchus fissidentatus]